MVYPKSAWRRISGDGHRPTHGQELRERFRGNQLVDDWTQDRQTSSRRLRYKWFGFDSRPTDVRIDQLLCQGHANALKAYMSSHCGELSVFNGPDERRRQFVQRPNRVTDPNERDDEENNYCLTHYSFDCPLVVVARQPASRGIN